MVGLKSSNFVLVDNDGKQGKSLIFDFRLVKIVTVAWQQIFVIFVLLKPASARLGLPGKVRLLLPCSAALIDQWPTHVMIY